jgi:hypothetical protein
MRFTLLSKWSDSKGKEHDRARKVILTVFFSSAGFITLDALPSDESYRQESLTSHVLPDLVKGKMPLCLKYPRFTCCFHMDSSMCDNRRKVTAEMFDAKRKHLCQAPYSSDLSLCDFWHFWNSKARDERSAISEG